MLDRIYLEITNICNLDCSFCHKTKRDKRLMTADEFKLILGKITGKSRYLFFHLMGEPTLHKNLPEFIGLAKEKGFLTAITTNGSTLADKGDILVSAEPYKVSISLHAPEANPQFSDKSYLKTCVMFARRMAERGTYVALRLWNLGSGVDNTEILEFLHNEFPSEWTAIRRGNSQRIADRIFLEWGEYFDWPDPMADEAPKDADLFCYGLREQIGILVDGTVVPCCLDADGNIPLGNIYEMGLDEILSSPRARAIYDGFSRRLAVESLCRKCGFAKRFSK